MHLVSIPQIETRIGAGTPYSSKIFANSKLLSWNAVTPLNILPSSTILGHAQTNSKALLVNYSGTIIAHTRGLQRKEVKIETYVFSRS